MPSPPDQHAALRSQKVEFQELPGGDTRCTLCNIIVTGVYYRVDGTKVCYRCFEREGHLRRNTLAVFLRALLFGLVGALLGILLYSATELLFYTGIGHRGIGYASLAVGFLVAKAVMAGSRNIGGLRYRCLAVALTYLAVALSAAPISYAVQSIPDARAIATQAEPPANHAPARPAQGDLALSALLSPLVFQESDPVNAGLSFLLLLTAVSLAWKLSAGRPLPVIEGPF